MYFEKIGGNVSWDMRYLQIVSDNAKTAVVTHKTMKKIWAQLNK